MSLYIYKDPTTGENFPVASDTIAVSHSQLKTDITPLFQNYNLSSLWGGVYVIGTAIAKMDSTLLDEQKVPGVHIEFTNSAGAFEAWEYFGQGHDFSDELGWRRCDSSTILELQEYCFPLDVSLSANPNLIAVGNGTTNVTFTWTIKRRGINVTSLASKKFEGNVVDTTNTTLAIDNRTHRTVTYNFSGAYQGLAKDVSTSITFNHNSYFGVIDRVPSNALEVMTALSSMTTLLRSGRSYTSSGVTMDNKRTCYIYPSYFGDLTSIKDANNFEYINSYTKTSVTVPGMTTYFVYYLTDPTTITNFKQIYA